MSSFTISDAPQNIQWTSLVNSKSGQYVYALGNSNSRSYIYYSHQYGLSQWTQTTLDTYPTYTSLVTNDSGQYVYIIGAYTVKKVYCSSDYGITWNETDLFPFYEWKQIVLNAGNKNFYIISTDGYVFKSIDSTGLKWIQTSAPTTYVWDTIISSSNGQYAYLINKSFFFYFTQNSGVSWNNTFNKFIYHIEVVVSKLAQYVYDLLYNANIGYSIRFSNNYGGDTFTPFPVPPYTLNRNKTIQHLVTDDTGKYLFFSSVDLQTHLCSIVTVGNYGSGNTAFVLPTAGVTIRKIVASYDAQYAFALASNGQLYFSTNYGQSWSTRDTFINPADLVCDKYGQNVNVATQQNGIYQSAQTYSQNSRIVLQFANLPPGQLLQPPVTSILGSIQVLFSDGTPPLTLQQGFAPFPVSSPNISIAIRGSFLQFGNSQNKWLGSPYLTAVTEWSEIMYMPGAFFLCPNLTQLPTYFMPTTIDCRYMLMGTASFTGVGVVENWDTSHVRYMDSMFAGSGLNTSLGNWPVTSLLSAQNMFDNCAMNKTYYSATLVGWALEALQPNVTVGVAGLQYNTSAFIAHQVLTGLQNGWSLIGDSYYQARIVLKFSGLTPNVTAIQLPLRNTYGVAITMSSTDGTVKTFTAEYPNNPYYIPTQASVTVTVTDGFQQFGNGDRSQIAWLGSEFLTKVASWTGITSFTGAFIHSTNLTTLPLQLPAYVVDTSFMFYLASAYTGFDICGNSIMKNWDTTSVTNMTAMFTGCSNLSPLVDLSGWQTRNLLLAEGLFGSCSQFGGLGIDRWNTSSVTNMIGMFHNCVGLLPNLDFTPGKGGNPGIWNTANVRAMDSMFFGCAVTGVGIGLWSTQSVQTMTGMFAFCPKLVVDFTPGKGGNTAVWNTGNVFNMQKMFYYATSTNNFAGIPLWNTSSVNYFDSMFEGANIDTSLGLWKIPNAISMTRMFNVSLMTQANYSATLAGWSQQTAIPKNVNLGAVGLFYNATGVAAKAVLSDKAYSWTFFGDYNSAATFNFGVLLSWNAPSVMNGATILKYIVKVDIQESKQPLFFNTQFDETYYAIYNLEYNNHYTFYVAAMTDKGLMSDYSSPTSILYFTKNTPYVTPKRYATDPNISTPLKYVNYIKADIRAVPTNPHA